MPPADFDQERRRLLLAGAAGTLALSLPCVAAAAESGSPFTLGVASGEPSADGFVIWTRLAPKPLAGGGMAPMPVEVEWQVARDENMSRVVRRGSALATPEWAHTLHVEVSGLEPDRWYWYRFRTGRDWSPIGRSRTAPAPGARPETLRFAIASCQHYEDGYYGAYRHMLDDTPDLIVHLGDYLYESNAREPVRRHGSGEPHTLTGYRNRHALYKLDADLQRAHAACPWLLTWDDHDVENDYAGAVAQDFAPRDQFLRRRAAAYQAWYEHLPLRASARPDRLGMRLYRAVDFGTLTRFHVLDARQYRDDQPCGDGRDGGGRLIADCAERGNPARSLFGREQERWLEQGLAASPARWNVLAQSMLMARLDQRPGPERAYWSDGWDGYPAARQRLLDTLHRRRVANPVVIGGDIHSFWANDLLLDFDDPNSAVIASEFVGTSISSRGVPYETFKAMLPENPHVKYFESRQRGYALCELRNQELSSRFRGLDEVRDPASGIRTLAAFAVEAGHPGVQRA